MQNADVARAVHALENSTYCTRINDCSKVLIKLDEHLTMSPVTIYIDVCLWMW